LRRAGGAIEIRGCEARPRLRHVQAAIGRQAGGDGVGDGDCGRLAAGAERLHDSTRAAGPATGLRCTSLSKPARANATAMPAAARSASARDSHQANTLGPAPEMLAPIAPASSAARLTASKPAISGARR